MSVISRLLRDAAGKDPLTPLIDEYLLTREGAKHRLQSYEVPLLRNEKRFPGRLSPSKIKGCERLAAFSFIGVRGQKTKDPATERVFSRGNWTHHEWQAIFTDMERVLGADRFRLVAVEERVSVPRFFIRGSLDACLMIEGVPYIVDIKSARDRSFMFVFESGPDPQHLDQLTTYQRAKSCKHGMVFYTNKNDQNDKVFSVAFDTNRWKRIARWAQRVIDHLEAHTLPPKHEDCTKGSRMEKQCPYASICYSGKSDRVIERFAYEGAQPEYSSPQQWWERGLEMEEAATQEPVA